MAEDGQCSYIESKENFIKRFSSLLAVSSTCDVFYNAYNCTKVKYPVVASVCEVAERGIKITTALALKSMQPVLQKLRPQIAVANVYACKGLDHLEEKFPVLHEDSTKIASDVKEMAVRKMKNITDQVTSPILHVSDKAMNVVTYRLEKTKGLVDESVTSVLNSEIGRLITIGVDDALSRSEQLVDCYLPNENKNDEDLSGEETISLSKPPHKNYKRVYVLVSKVYSHAYKHVVMFIWNAKKQGQEIIALVPDVWLVPTVPGLRKNFQNVFIQVGNNITEVSNVVQVKKQQTFKTVQKFYSQLWSMNLSISPGHFVIQIKEKLWNTWKTLHVRKDDVLSGLVNTLLLPGLSLKEDETEENQNQGWTPFKPSPAKGEEMVQISEGIPESQMPQGREPESIPSENSISVSSSAQSEKEGKRPAPESHSQQLQRVLKQLSARVPIFQEQQAIGEDFQQSVLRYPISF